tara:strand:+ start:33056 stop:33160 length:105 start_codon:yes stop_codon:yes gene_type:complete
MKNLPKVDALTPSVVIDSSETDIRTFGGFFNYSL